MKSKMANCFTKVAFLGFKSWGRQWRNDNELFEKEKVRYAIQEKNSTHFISVSVSLLTYHKSRRHEEFFVCACVCVCVCVFFFFFFFLSMKERSCCCITLSPPGKWMGSDFSNSETEVLCMSSVSHSLIDLKLLKIPNPLWKFSYLAICCQSPGLPALITYILLRL